MLSRSVLTARGNMKITAQFKGIMRDWDGNGIAQLFIPNIQHISMMRELEPEKTYSVELKEIRSKRSIEQNRLLWALLHEIDIAINGERSNDEWDIYIEALEKAGAKYDYVGALPEAENALKENFRAIKFIKKIDLNGKEGNMYKVFIGSSKMDTKEMSVLIDTVLDMAEDAGVETIYYENLLR